MDDSKKAKALDFLNQIPPDLSGLENLDLTPEDATQLAYAYAEACWCEGLDNFGHMEEYYSWCNCDPAVIPGYHSTHLYEVLSFLLKHGADPNYQDDHDYSLMEYVIHTVNGYVAADSLRLLLESGGDPNLMSDGDRLITAIDHDVGFGALNQEDRRRYDSLVHCWLVLIGFGAKQSEGSEPIDLFSEWFPDGWLPIDAEKLKEHENYCFGISRGIKGPIVHVFDKRTYWEVARR